MAQQHRQQLAQTASSDAVSFLQAQHTRTMRAAVMHFNADVMSTLLYGCGVWGWPFFQGWHWLRNTFQSMHADFLKTVLKLPRSTPNVAVLCESGSWPVMFYALRQAARFLHSIPSAGSRMLSHLYSIDCAGGLKQKCADLLARFHISGDSDAWCAELLPLLQDEFLRLVLLQRGDPTDPDDAHRKISAYLSWVWDGKLHSRPKFYSLDMDPLHFYVCMQARMMNAYLPVNVRTATTYARRVCPFCKQGVCDLQHVLSVCPYFGDARAYYTALVGGHKLVFPDLLQSRDSRVWAYVAQVLMPFKEVCHRRKRRRSSVDD